MERKMLAWKCSLWRRENGSNVKKENVGKGGGRGALLLR
jgi:hypothetical protein